MQVDHANQLVLFIDYGHRDDSVLLHSVDNRAPELVVMRKPWGLSHYRGDSNRHHVRDRARHPAPAGPKRPAGIRRADRFCYSLDGNRLLQPRERDVRLFPQCRFAAGPEMD